MPDETLADTIARRAAQPASATQDGTTMTQHSLSEQIAADRYLSSKSAARRRGTGLRFHKIISGGP